MLDNQQEIIYNSSVGTQGVVWKTYRKRWIIGTNGERERFWYHDMMMMKTTTSVTGSTLTCRYYNSHYPLNTFFLFLFTFKIFLLNAPKQRITVCLVKECNGPVILAFRAQKTSSMEINTYHENTKLKVSVPSE